MSSYSPPAIWFESEDLVRGMNKPSAGPRSVKELPRGQHDLQLYSLGTPNGQKVTIMLEELGVEYDAWIIEIGKLDQFTTGFVDINPNSKIPALVDHSFSPPLNIFESVSILIYLGDKYGKFIPKEVVERTEVMNWLVWQVGTAPYIGGGFGHFYKYAPVKIEYCINRFAMETKRILSVLDRRLEGRDYVCGEYCVVDIAIYPWVQCIDTGYKAAEFIQLYSYKNIMGWLGRICCREAVKRGVRVNGLNEGDLKERHSKSDF